MSMNKEKASVAQAEREIKALKSENAELKKELDRIRSLYKQLTEEGPAENYDERRVNLLKSQVIQLERQVLIQSDALASRAAALLVVENSLQNVSAQLRELLASEVHGPSVPVKRSQLTTLIENTEAARIRLYKNIEHCGTEKLLQPILYMGGFLKPGRGEQTTLLQVCSGKLEHVNLKQVAKLESKLFSLHKQLQAVHQSLSTIWSTGYQTSCLTNQHVALPVNQRLSGQLAKCSKSLQECCQDLLILSILTPAAPWPLLQRPGSPDINIDSVMSSLPSFPKSKHQQVKSSVTALLKACNYSRQVSKLETKACAEELKFHQAVYHLQIQYTESLFNAVREAYSAFEKSVQSLICQPLLEILQEFSKLKTSASEEALKDFLTSFKSHSEQLESIVQSLEVVQDGGQQSPGQEALSQFGREFLTSVHSAARQCAEERDKLVQEIQEVKQMQEQHAKDELITFVPPTEEQQRMGEHSKEVLSAQNQEGESDAEHHSNSKAKHQHVSSSAPQNGVAVRHQPDKKTGTAIKSPTSGGPKQVVKARQGSDRDTPRKPPIPSSRGIPSPVSKPRVSSKNMSSPSSTSQRSSSLSSIPIGPIKGKGTLGKSASHSTSSSIPKLSPRSGIPRANSTPSRLGQQGLDGASWKRASSISRTEDKSTDAVVSEDGHHKGNE